MKKILRRIIPHIIPETILFFTKILPVALIIDIFFFYQGAQNYNPSMVKTLLWGLLTCIAGIYLMRITAYAVKATLVKIKNIIPDVYYDESQNK